jgi:hypothetical protein
MSWHVGATFSGFLVAVPGEVVHALRRSFFPSWTLLEGIFEVSDLLHHIIALGTVNTSSRISLRNSCMIRGVSDRLRSKPMALTRPGRPLTSWRLPFFVVHHDSIAFLGDEQAFGGNDLTATAYH